MPNSIPAAVSKYFATIGARGGAAKSEAKKASAKRAAKLRWKAYRAAKKQAK